MNWLFKLNNFFRIWGATFRAMGKIKIWVPLVILFLIQILFLYILVRFYQPPWSAVLIPILKGVLGDRVLHYPQFYMSLPAVYSLVNLVLVGFFSIFANAMVVWLLTSHFWGNRLNMKEAWEKANRRFGHLFLIWLLNTLVAAAIFFLPSLLFSFWIAGSPRRMLFIQTAGLVVGVLVSCLFAFCFNLILVSASSWLKSLSLNFDIFRRNFFSTCFFIGIPGLISWGYGVLVGNAPLVMSKLRPEVIPFLLTAGSVLNIIVVFWITGALTRLFLYEMKEA